MAKYASKVVEQARAWLGNKEGSAGHKAIIDIYNAHKPLARGYKVKYTDSWCATFVSAVAIKLGYTDIIHTECGCGKMIELFKKLGAWIENENRTPNPGDVIFYDWQDNGRGDNTGNPDHVGIVEKVTNGKIIVIEGNHDGTDADRIDGVERREISVNGRYIRGYGVPKYDKSTTEKRADDLTKADVIAIIKEYEAEKAKEAAGTWSKEAFAKAKAKGIMDGSAPKSPATREQLAVMLDRLNLL